jgi:hypothetical protein
MDLHVRPHDLLAHIRDADELNGDGRNLSGRGDFRRHRGFGLNSRQRGTDEESQGER